MNKKKIEIDDFSSGLWRMKVTLLPYGGDRAEMSVEDIYPFLRSTKTNSPLLVRINRTFVPLYEGNSIPYKSLAIPEDVEEELNLELPTEKYVLVPKNQNELKKILMNEESVGGFDDDGQ